MTPKLVKVAIMDCSTGTLYIKNIEYVTEGDFETDVQNYCDKFGISFGDSSWGEVLEIDSDETI